MLIMDRSWRRSCGGYKLILIALRYGHQPL